MDRDECPPAAPARDCGAFLFHPPFKIPKSFFWRPLRAERYVVITPAGETGTDPLQLLREQPLVRYDRSLWSGQIADSYLRQQRIRPSDRIELDALDAIAVLVHRGLGVSLVPDRALPWPEGLAITKHALPRPGTPTRTRFTLATRVHLRAAAPGSRAGDHRSHERYRVRFYACWWW